MITRAPWGGLATGAQRPPDVVILGVPYDGSACWRACAAEAPGMDIVEIAPPLDPTDATLFLGLQLVFETFAVLARKAAVS